MQTRKLSLRIIAVMIVTLLIICLVSGIVFYRSILSSRTEMLATQTLALSNKVDGWLNIQKNTVESNARLLNTDTSLTREDIQRYFTHLFESNAAFSDVYVGFADKSAMFGMGWVPPDDYDVTTRPWYKNAVAAAGNVIFPAPYYDLSYNAISLSATRTISDSDGSKGVVAVDVSLETLEKYVNDPTDLLEGSYAFLMDTNGDVLMHPDPAFAPNDDATFKNLPNFDGGAYAELYKQLTAGADTFLFDGSYYSRDIVDNTGWYVISVVPSAVITRVVFTSELIQLAILVVSIVVSSPIIMAFIRRYFSKPISNLTLVADELALGNPNVNFDENDKQYRGEIQVLAASFSKIAGSYLNISEVTQNICDGNYLVHIEPRSEKDVIYKNLKRMVGELNNILFTIREAASKMEESSSQASGSASVLAAGAEESNSVLFELTERVKHIADTVSLNTEISATASDLSQKVKVNAEKGSTQMQDMTEAVRDINAASSDIQRVIKVIDDIAFQTNILALNAAVEAARAGQHGKGFAVVADEVRNLASKSADAAKETTVFIENSMKTAERGTRIADETAESFREIVSGIDRSVEIITQIASSSQGQSDDIHEISDAIKAVAQNVDDNAHASEASAGFSHDMSDLALRLNADLKKFKLRQVR
jgi:methyl-accepting chemotaxis protein